MMRRGTLLWDGKKQTSRQQGRNVGGRIQIPLCCAVVVVGLGVYYWLSKHHLAASSLSFSLLDSEIASSVLASNTDPVIHREEPSTTSVEYEASFCQSPQTRTFEIMPHHEIKKVIQEFGLFEYNAARQIRFRELGRRVYERALSLNQTLFTIQVGGYDGITNDAMRSIFRTFFGNYRHWLPFVVEPVEENFAKLQTNYQEFQKKHQLLCPMLLRHAISYQPQHSNHNRMCEFCHFNNQPDAPSHCSKNPSWQRFQVGTLTCHDYYKNHVHGRSFSKDCVIRTEVPCGTISQALQTFDPALLMEKMIPISMFIIDVEGQEGQIIEGFFRELDSMKKRHKLFTLPSIIFFESKIMARKDEAENTTVLTKLTTLLRNHGYNLQDNGDNVLALFFDPPPIMSLD